MRKFLLPIINLVNVVLVSIAWGLSGNTAVIDAARSDQPSGNIYQVIWEGEAAAQNVNAMGIVGFFLFILACALMLVSFFPLKPRKYLTCVGGLSFIASGVLFLNAPWHYARAIFKVELTGSLIALAVLLFIAGAFMLVMSIIEICEKKTEIVAYFKKISKLDKLYLGLSCGAFALSLFILIFTVCKFVPWLIFVVFALILAYAVTIFVLELKKGKVKASK